jgi:chemotaxis regulatin CheY-phosphate phosphatase CheZ
MDYHNMADQRSLTTISEADYEAIESAVMETERGRWFLSEYTRRNRNADTQVLLDAIGRLEQAVAGARIAQEADPFRASLREMASAIARTKTDIASIHAIEHEQSRLFEASEALDAIIRTTEQATSDILAAAEHIQESAWTLREEGVNADLCDELDRRATEIYTACSFQDITAQRIAKVIQTLRYLEGRINAMIAVWDRTEAALPPESETPEPSYPLAPEPRANDLDQSEVDNMIVDEKVSSGSSAPVEEAGTTGATEEPPSSSTRLRVEAFATIDEMPTREKLRAFT